MNIYGIVFSLGLHLLVLFLILWHALNHRVDPPVTTENRMGFVNVKIYDTGLGGIHCSHHYDGIGLYLNFIDGKVMGALSTLPAYQAGIRVGDIINLDELNYSSRIVGNPIVLHIIRNGVKITVYPIVAKICDEE